MSRLREGRANTARGGAHFLRERWGGFATVGPAGSSLCGPTAASIPTPWSPSAAGLDVRFSITIRQHKSLHNLIEAIPEDAWTPIPYWMDGAAAVAETTYTPFQSEPDAAPVRLIIRRVQPTPRLPTGSLRHLQLSRPSSPTGTEKPWNWRLTIAATPRSRTRYATSSTASG